WIAFGRSLLRMKLPVAAPAGQGCHCTSLAVSGVPMPMSDFATRISTVSGLAAAGLVSGGFSDRPASKAATPPAPRAMTRTARRAAFILDSQAHNAAESAARHVAAHAAACTD